MVQLAEYTLRCLPPASPDLRGIAGPILDPTEFPARFFAHAKGTQPLGNEGKILLQLLVVWAASFGIDERGLPETDDLPRPSSSSSSEEQKHPRNGRINGDTDKSAVLGAQRRRAERKIRTEAMVQEILVLVDSHAIMRKPTWDGVRVLLLILPLMEGSYFFFFPLLVY